MTACEERNIVVCENIGLVHACAKRFHGRGIEYDDLYQAGCVGLIKAADGFESERGLKFSTYAVPVILGEIKRLFREGGAVKISRSLKELSLRSTKERERLAKELGREPSVEELAAALQVDAALAAQAVTASLPPLSLTRHGEQDEDEQIDLPIDSPETAITDRLALKQLLSELEERDRRIIELRYGARRTQQAIAAQLGMTQVQVSRRERAILHALREKLIG